MPLAGPTHAVLSLGTAQTLAWASSYYLPAMLAWPMARELGIGAPTVFLAFSVALVVSAAVGPGAGRLIDRHGGRPVLMATSLLFATGLAALGMAQGPVSLFLAWMLIGVAMGSGLYEAAFATLVRLYGQGSRRAITGITLMAGFASTIGWPLSAWLESAFGWREACFAWAALHLLIGLPLNAGLPGGGPAADGPASAAPAPRHGRADHAGRAGHADQAGQAGPAARAPAAGTMPTTRPPPAGGGQSAVLISGLLAYVFAATWFCSTAMAAHLPGMMMAAGATPAAAVAIGALVGPAQVAGRLLEFGLLQRLHPLLSARLAALAHPAGAAALLALGTPLAPVFAVLHGAGNGILTIAKGTLPLVFFGPQGYGARQGWLMLPARVAQAAAPWLFGLALVQWQGGALWLTGALGLSAFGALLLLRPRRAARDTGDASALAGAPR